MDELKKLLENAGVKESKRTANFYCSDAEEALNELSDHYMFEISSGEIKVWVKTDEGNRPIGRFASLDDMLQSWGQM